MKFTFAPESRPLDGYTIKRAIYRGGFGEVYYAVTDAGREVALKLLQNNSDVELRGIRQCLNLSHPNLVTIFDVRQDADGDHWIIMEYVAGETLDAAVRRFPKGMPMEEVRKWVAGTCEGVAHLHQRGLVHRDLKPGNVFSNGPIVKVGDVGLSKFITPSRRSAQTQSVGTVYYMAPEVAKGRYGKEVDVYAMGIMLFEMLTGQVPFDGESTAEILLKHLTQKPDLSQLPPRLRNVVAKALEKDPEQRYHNLNEFLTAFNQAVLGKGEAIPIPVEDDVWKLDGKDVRSPGQHAPAGQSTQPLSAAAVRPLWSLSSLPRVLGASAVFFGTMIITSDAPFVPGVILMLCGAVAIYWIMKPFIPQKSSFPPELLFGYDRGQSTPLAARGDHAWKILKAHWNLWSTPWRLAAVAAFAAVFLTVDDDPDSSFLRIMLLSGAAVYWLYHPFLALIGHASEAPSRRVQTPAADPETMARPMPLADVAPGPAPRPMPQLARKTIDNTPTAVPLHGKRLRIAHWAASAAFAVPVTALITAAVAFFTPSAFENLAGQSEMDPAAIAFFGCTAIVGVWVLSFVAKFTEVTHWQGSALRILFASAGAGFGAFAFWLQHFLLVQLPTLRYRSGWPVFETIGERPLLIDGNPSVIGYMVFFAALFGLRSWGRLSELKRAQRFSPISIGLTALLGYGITRFFAFPCELAVLWAATMASAVQLTNAWAAPVSRPHVSARLRQAVHPAKGVRV